MAVAAVTSILAGMATSALLAVINKIAWGVGHGVASVAIAQFVALALLALVTVVGAQLSLAYVLTRCMFELRMDLCRRLYSVPLRQIEEIGGPKLLAVLTDDMPALARALSAIPVVLRHVATVVAALVYLVWLSPKVFLVVAGILIVGLPLLQLSQAAYRRVMRRIRSQVSVFYEQVRGLIDGAKELRLHSVRGEEFFAKELSRNAESLRKETVLSEWINAGVVASGRLLFCAILGFLLVGAYYDFVNRSVLASYVLVILFIQGPIENIITFLPNMGRVSVAFQELESLGLSLERSADETHADNVNEPEKARDITLTSVTVTYRRDDQEKPFTLGPIDLRIRAGEVVFLVGGNGSGKSTLGKVLCGLYRPESGRIHVGDTAVTDANRGFYRQHFSAVFADFYLFDRLWGLNGRVRGRPSRRRSRRSARRRLDARAHKELTKLRLDHKVQVKGGRFSTLALSQGQRKRLALLVTLLEDRPMCVFDEWAADQDVSFKRTFYMDIVPGLKARGKTVVVITHDDRYFHLADRIVKLEDGKVVEDAVERALEGLPRAPAEGGAIPLNRP
jgi:putative ATP-binding cassette transporter